MAINQETKDAAGFWLFILLTVAFCVFAGRAITSYPPLYVLGAVACAAVGLVTFLFPKIGLALVVFSMLLSPRVEGGHLGATAAVFKANDFLLLAILLAWVGRTAVFKGTALFVKTPLNLPIQMLSAVFFLATFAGILRGNISPTRSLFYCVKYVEYFLMFFMTVNVVDSRDDVHRYLRYGLVTALAVTVYGYVQIPAGQRVTAPFDNTIGGTGANQAANASEPNTFGGYFVAVIGILLGYYTQTEGNSSLAALASFLFMVPPFLLTQSRASYLGMLVGVIFHMVSTPRRQVALFFGLGMAFIIVLAVPNLRQTVTKRVAYTFGAQGDVAGSVTIGEHKVKLEGSTMARVSNWRRIFTQVLPAYPFLGLGVTGVGLVDAYYPRLAGETGLVGLVVFFWLAYRIWNLCWGLYALSPRMEDKALALGLLTALVGLLIHAVGANTFIIVRIMEPFWFVTALAARLYVDEKSSRPEFAAA